MKSRVIAILLISIIIFYAPFANAGNLTLTANYLQKNVAASGYSGMLDWVVLALSAADKDTLALINRRENQVREKVLFEPRKSTDYHRTIIGAVSARKNPRNFAGYNLIEDVKKSQLSNGKFADSIDGTGDFLVNAHVWGIISLYMAGETIAKKDEALGWLVAKQNVDGGFSIDTRIKSSDIDITAMALMAFSALGKGEDYFAVQKALQYIKEQQGGKGDFISWGGSSSETLAQVIQALVMLGIDPAGPQWTEIDGNLITALLAYKKNDGSFSHSIGGQSNIMSTYQSLLALADYYEGESIFKRLRRENMYFTDLPDKHFAANSIKLLAAEGVINGYPDGSFRPADTVKRQEFAKMIVLALNANGQFESKTRSFMDVPISHWANPYIKVAADKGLIKGKSNQLFAPADSITGAEVMAILIRALGNETSVQVSLGEPWYVGYVKEAERAGLLYPGFDATKIATRAQCAYSLALIR